MTNNSYLPPFLLTNTLLNLYDTKFSCMGTQSSLFFYLFIHSDTVLSDYHRSFNYCSNIIDSNLLYRLSIDFMNSRPLCFHDINIQEDHCISAVCKDTTIKIYNNADIYNDHNFLSLLQDPDESYIYDNLITINSVNYHNIIFKVLSVEDTVSSLFFNYYNHKDTTSLLDAITLTVIYREEIVFNKLIIRCLQVFNNTKPFLAALSATEYLTYDYLYSLNYSKEHIISTINYIKKLL